MSSAGTAGLTGLVRLRPAETTPRPQPTWDESIVVAHEVIGDRYHRLVLHSPSITARASAGQFVMITVPSSPGSAFLLPRPMAIHRRRVTTGEVEVIFAIVDRGTDALTEARPGDRLLLTGPLGRGFEIAPDARHILLIGRGIGVCGVMGAAEDASIQGVSVSAMLSAGTRGSVIGEADCAELGAEAIVVSDDDGSSAIPAVESVLRRKFDDVGLSSIMVCGSTRLVRLAVKLGQEWNTPVQVSLEAHMACGLGYCHGCAAPISTGADTEGPLVCVDGPVFDAGSVA